MPLVGHLRCTTTPGGLPRAQPRRLPTKQADHRDRATPRLPRRLPDQHLVHLSEARSTTTADLHPASKRTHCVLRPSTRSRDGQASLAATLSVPLGLQTDVVVRCRRPASMNDACQCGHKRSHSEGLGEVPTDMYQHADILDLVLVARCTTAGRNPERAWIS